MIRYLLLGGVAALAMTGTANATLVTLDVSSFGPAANRAFIGDTFGDTSLVDFTWSAGPSGAAQFWNDEYSNDDAAWCGLNASAVCSVTIANISPNHRMTLTSVRFGGYLNADRGINVTLGNTLGETASTSLIANGATGHLLSFIFFSFVSQGGSYTLQWGPDGFNGGLTSITYEIERIQGGEVSEPATLALLGAGLLGLAAVRRRRA